MRIHIINGPNLNLLGRRQPDIYGTLSLGEINARVEQEAKLLGVEVAFFQANGEGEVIEKIQAGGCEGLVINPGAYAHYSLAIADALAGVGIPAIEVHLTNVFAREEIRSRHVTAGSCQGYICGLGWRGYLVALTALTDLIRESETNAEI